MPGEIFNPNPTVFSPIRPVGRQSDLSHSLWISEGTEPEDATDDVEPIDQDEIYGRSTSQRNLHYPYSNRPHSFNLGSRTSKHTGGATRRLCTSDPCKGQSRHRRVHTDSTALWHVYFNRSVPLSPYALNLNVRSRLVDSCSAPPKPSQPLQGRHLPQAWFTPERIGR
jgi:hypothetical protein